MIKKILIANRGEIALRIIRTCKELDIQTVVVHSKVDKDEIYINLADEAYCIGHSSSDKTYLSIPKLLTVAKLTNSDAIHPGYGYLSENDEFARICEENDVIFIGPKSKTIKKMGDKNIARQTMINSNVPVVPGSEGIVKSLKEAEKEASIIGYPIILKAVSGGGGKGIRVVKKEEDLEMKFLSTQNEAKISFGNSDIYIEKFIENFRHIEIQILADQQGNVVHLGERDCTIQRRMQKLIEETPANILDDKTQKKMGLASVKAAQAIGYVGAGTIEYIYDLNTKKFYFMEMNTRIQVEHTITEVSNSIDLIKEQINIANNKTLNFQQEDIEPKFHVIECRINAENPNTNFSPSVGEINKYFPPGGYGVRIDSNLYQDYNVTPFYDSMISKVIVYANNRTEAIKRMERALDEYIIEGIDTTIPFQKLILQNHDFKNNNYNTEFINTLIHKE